MNTSLKPTIQLQKTQVCFISNNILYLLDYVNIYCSLFYIYQTLCIAKNIRSTLNIVCTVFNKS